METIIHYKWKPSKSRQFNSYSTPIEQHLNSKLSVLILLQLSNEGA
jgi:hypothetical protein